MMIMEITRELMSIFLDFKPIVDWYLKQTGQELVEWKKTSMQSVVPPKRSARNGR